MQKVSMVEFPYFQDSNGDLTVMEGLTDPVPFKIARIFNVRAEKGNVRGHHAHRHCTQFLVCANGAVEVSCDDGSQKKSYILDRPSAGLLIQPGVWAEQKYLKNDTVLTVLCDLPFQEEEYIRNYGEFISYLARAKKEKYEARFRS